METGLKVEVLTLNFVWQFFTKMATYPFYEVQLLSPLQSLIGLRLSSYVQLLPYIHDSRIECNDKKVNLGKFCGGST